MFESTKALREQRLKVVADARAILTKAETEKRELSAEESAQWEKAHQDERALKGKIDRLEQQEKIEAELKKTDSDSRITQSDYDGRQAGADSQPQAPTEEDRAYALQAWCRGQFDLKLSKRHKEAVVRCKVKPKRRFMDLRLGKNYPQIRQQSRMAAKAKRNQLWPGLEERALSAFAPAAGAYTVPEGFVSNLETALLAYANLREVADVMRTDSGNDLPWPTANDTSNKGALVGENVAVATNVDPTMGQVIFKAYKYTSKIILVPAELLEDSAFELANWLGDMCGIRIGRIQADHFTTGTGNAQPTGLVTAATLGLTAASATAIAADEIYGLKHSVDPAYRKGASFMFHDNVLLAIKKLKDAFGRYLWQASLAGGAPDRLDDDPITINQSMASSIATTNKTMLYGFMPKFKIRDVNQIRMRRLVERYADADQEGFVMFMRSDSNLLDAGTHPVKYLQQA